MGNVEHHLISFYKSSCKGMLLLLLCLFITKTISHGEVLVIELQPGKRAVSRNLFILSSFDDDLDFPPKVLNSIVLFKEILCLHVKPS